MSTNTRRLKYHFWTMKTAHLFPIFFSNLVTICLCEPFTIGTVAGAFALVASYASYGFMKCQIQECCSKPWINFDKPRLEKNMTHHLYGQHLAKFTILRSLSAHMKKDNPRKALVMSFHGATGSGKNFVSHMIADCMYKNGMDSKYVHQYIANRDFQHKEKVSQYQDRIREDVTRFTKDCDRSLFIFDEVDKMPPGTLDALKPFLDYYEKIDDVDYKKNIFVFLSNSGSQGIVDIALSFWAQGRDREDITMKDIEPLISRGAFNERGGFQFSELLSSELIDLYVPFLPLEKKHVRKCIEAYLEHHSLQKHRNIVNKIADQLVYFPEESELYSTSGCKRIDQKVDVELAF